VSDYDYDDDLERVDMPVPEVERSRRRVRRLYGPTGKVILSVSKRPPVGFHQGERGKP
jgi:hypothetical protein